METIGTTERGLFISFEGGEAVGKSTQIALLAATLRAEGREVLLTREPGGSPGAEAIRALILNPETVTVPLADTMMMFAARADHVATVIRPAMARGVIVLCDRYVDSSTAYQGFGLGVSRKIIAGLTRMIDLMPDLTLVLDADPVVTAARLAARPGALDRYERFDAAFAARVHQGFREIAAGAPDRCVVLDASGGIDHVSAAILSVVYTRIRPTAAQAEALADAAVAERKRSAVR